jgi:hypothetical protein
MEEKVRRWSAGALRESPRKGFVQMGIRAHRGFGIVLAFIRGQKIRYHQWRTKRLEAQARRLEAERDRYERRARGLERRMAGDE